MANCDCFEFCPFLQDQMIRKPAMAEVYKQRYCCGNNKECARHMVLLAKGRNFIPADLFPNQVDRAKRIIAGRRDLLAKPATA
ncbi:MAG: hypothetical protein GX444_08700 [Myxococcales bacterium]|nr:hypothetical protein [Myxococcales bacterium]